MSAIAFYTMVRDELAKYVGTTEAHKLAIQAVNDMPWWAFNDCEIELEDDNDA